MGVLQGSRSSRAVHQLHSVTTGWPEWIACGDMVAISEHGDDAEIPFPHHPGPHVGWSSSGSSGPRHSVSNGGIGQRLGALFDQASPLV